MIMLVYLLTCKVENTALLYMFAGTIVGSAVFNILFVIGMCGLLSHDVLQLTWWPLFRDCSFYIISLVFLIYSFSDAEIQVSLLYENVIVSSHYFCLSIDLTSNTLFFYKNQ